MKRVLVTGGAGFVGSYLVKLLIESGNQVWNTSKNIEKKATDSTHETILELDITNSKEVSNVFDIVKPEEVYHLAAITKPGLDKINEFYEVNLYGTINIFENSIKHNCRVLSVSSAYVYGSDYDVLIEEVMPLKPINHYGISKSAADQLCLHYHKKGLSVVCARPFNHTGPGQSDGFLVPSILKQCQASKSTGDAITLGNVNTTRDFLDVRDVITVYSKLMETGVSGESFNVCSGIGMTVKDIFNSVNKLFGGNIALEIEETKKREFDIPSLVGNNKKLKSHLGNFQQYNFEDTLAYMISQL